MMIIIIISFVSILSSLVTVAEVKESPEEYLKAHNAERASVGVPPLKWDEKLAQEVVYHLNKDIKYCMEDKDRPKSKVAPPYYGYNLSWRLRPDHCFTAAKAVAVWVAQKEFYDHKSNSCVGGECECYTQLVWRKTTHVGCARIDCHNCKSGCALIGCLYNPPRPFNGERPY